MGKLYLYWDPPCANAMSSSALDFVTGTLMEDKAEVQQMRLHPEARNWPKFLRTKTGISAMFAHSIFPKTAYPDLAIYAQALPDIEDFLSFVNDLFSYYKEELAGEDTNYVAIRAKVSANPPLRVVSDLVDEVTRYHEDILAMLSDHPQAVRRWREFVQSYLGFHLSVSRYRLSELGF
ncbi:hypothetical protein GYMLUDRAFT_176524 [Collybiopsis luxurians FD-317 M1]|uniref:Unplaced genomic scaffold GYMLUscaffold_64, whole genome shotgun sequence n=1 Tax=Collybiopsis luxurians FD-317 M1 TaxID=944289 RepID=A0A0D0BJD1_9AGAR|nr:hypothetical protein GYMLUDRAFT_176524 [Collybiopsis luxurians FD-317 M1]